MRTKARTSKSHPLQIATIPVPDCQGAIGVTICPGKKDKTSLAGPWRRDLAVDLSVIKAWGATTIVCLMKEFELGMLGVEDLPAATREAGLHWIHLPVVDVRVPGLAFEQAWALEGPKLHSTLADGQKILIHCRGGLGRSGMIAARLLIEAGVAPSDAITLVRRHRPGAIETLDQEKYVLRLSQPRKALKTMPSDSSEDRAIGCLIGLAVGDALGTTLEFSTRDSLPPLSDLVGRGPFNLRPGEWTDDTSMALCLADSLLARRGLDAADLMSRFREWREHGHNSVTGVCFDIGVTTSQAISRFVADGNPISGSRDPGTAGNGSIMRLAPVSIFYSSGVVEAEEAAALQSRTTHAADECVDACRLMGGILVRLVNGVPWREAIGNTKAAISAPRIEALVACEWADKSRAEIKSTGYVVDTLEAALWSVDRSDSFAEAVLLAVNLGGDADTVGAVAGQLAGARFGFRDIPESWRKEIAWADRIVGLAQQLLSTGRSRQLSIDCG